MFGRLLLLHEPVVAWIKLIKNSDIFYFRQINFFGLKDISIKIW